MTNAIRTNGAMASPRKWGTGVAAIWIAINIIANSAAIGQGQPPPATLALAMTVEQINQQMKLHYVPREEEAIRNISPPMVELRNEWLKRGPRRALEGELERIDHTVMIYSNGLLSSRTFGSGGQYLPLIRDSLGFTWYTLEGLDRISWPYVTGDLVVRSDVARDDKLAALAKYISDQTGASYRFVTQKRKRACIVVTGRLTQPTFQRADGFAAFVSQGAPDEFVVANSRERDIPPGFENAGTRLSYLGGILDTPIFSDERPGSPGTMYLVAPDAQLDASDPEHVRKLRKIIGNLQNQIGGEWRIEERELEVAVIDPLPGMHPAQRVFEDYVRAVVKNDAVAVTNLTEPQAQVSNNDLLAILGWNNNSITIDRIRSDGTAALVRSDFISSEGGRLGLVMMYLRPDQAGRWKVHDLAVRFAGGEVEVFYQQFRMDHPRAGDSYPRRGTQVLERRP